MGDGEPFLFSRVVADQQRLPPADDQGGQAGAEGATLRWLPDALVDPEPVVHLLPLFVVEGDEEGVHRERGGDLMIDGLQQFIQVKDRADGPGDAVDEGQPLGVASGLPHLIDEPFLEPHPLGDVLDERDGSHHLVVPLQREDLHALHHPFRPLGRLGGQGQEVVVEAVGEDADLPLQHIPVDAVQPSGGQFRIQFQQRSADHLLRRPTAVLFHPRVPELDHQVGVCDHDPEGDVGCDLSSGPLIHRCSAPRTTPATVRPL